MTNTVKPLMFLCPLFCNYLRKVYKNVKFQGAVTFNNRANNVKGKLRKLCRNTVGYQFA